MADQGTKGAPLRGGTEGGESGRVVDVPAAGEGTPGISSPSGGTRSGAHTQAGLGMADPTRGTAPPRLAGGKSPETILGYLDGVSFPAKKDAIIRAGARNGAPEDVLEAMRLLRATEYESAERMLGDYPRLPDEDGGA